MGGAVSMVVGADGEGGVTENGGGVTDNEGGAI